MNGPDSSNTCAQAYELPVEQFEPTLLWPVQVQAIRKADQSFLNKDADPDKPGFLERWADAIVGTSGSRWHRREGVYPSDKGPEYAEYVYFHPFVRNFLYASRGDIRASSDGTTYQNRNLVILERDRSDEHDSALIVRYRMYNKATGKTEHLVTRFTIRSCWLYLYDTQVAILELALQYESTKRDVEPAEAETLHSSSDRTVDLNLAIVMKLQDIIRHTYSAFWAVYSDTDVGDVVVDNSHVPDKLELEWNGELAASAVFGNVRLSADEVGAPDSTESPAIYVQNVLLPSLKPVRSDTTESARETAASTNEQLLSIADQSDYLVRHREPHTNKVLQELIYPLTPVMLESPPAEHCGLQFEHIQDERIPMMSYIAMGQAPSAFGQDNAARLISDGDWLRLAMLDESGNSTEFPYSPDFYNKDNPLETFAYDRFWHPTGKDNGAADWHGVRWLCSGFSFVAVGSAQNQFFTDDYAGALAFYRHHYYALFMIGIMHRASLLQYKHRLAEAMDTDTLGKDLKRVTRPQEELDYHFRRRTDNLQRELLRFRTIYWFSEVSNQIQGQELFSLLRGHLNLDSLFNDVSQDIEMATALVSSWEERKRSEVGYMLAVVGAAFVLLAPLGNFLKTYLPGASWWVNVMFLLSVMFIQAGVFASVISLPENWKWNSAPWVASYMRRVSRLTRFQLLARCWLIGFVLLACSLIGNKFSKPDPDTPDTQHTVSQ